MTGKQTHIVDLEQAQAQQQLLKAATDTGIFYVKNHGVKQESMDQLLQVYNKFFALPLEEKLKSKQTKDNMTGYTSMEQEKLDELATRGDTKEGYMLRMEPTNNKGKPTIDHNNKWPDEHVAPNLKQISIEYQQQAWDLAFRIIHLIAQALNLPAGYFDDKFKDPFVGLRPLHYSSEISNPEERIWGCGAHTDYGFISVLISDENDGLQIYDEAQKEWFDIKPIPGTIIIFVGDTLKGMTGGLLRSALHRVVNKKGVDRYSCACFFDPDYDASCEQIPTLDQFVKKPYNFPYKTYGEYLDERYSKTYAQFKE